MSARNAIARPPGREPLREPMIPVLAMSRSTAMPKDLEELGHLVRGAALLERGLGMGVQIVSPFRHFRMKIGNAVDDRHGFAPRIARGSH
jgi:hypothetical protein